MRIRLNSIVCVPAISFACFLIAAFPGLAQTDPSANPPDTMAQRGFYPTGSYSADDIESVNNVTGNVTLSIPLASLPPGRGGSSFGMNVYYNSSIFDLKETIISGNHLQLEYVKSNAGGWRYGYMYEVGWDVRPVVGGQNPTCNDQFYLYKAYIVLPDGSRRNLRLEGYSDNTDPTTQVGDSYYPVSPMGDVASGVPTGCGLTAPIITSATKLVYVTVDGSYIRLETMPTQKTWALFLADGTQVKGSNVSTVLPAYPSASGLIETITDRNGNNVYINNSCSTGGPCQRTITDDLTSTYVNRKIVITYGTITGGTSDTISWLGAPQSGSATTLTATVNYAPITLPSQTYSCLPDQYSGGSGTGTCNTSSISLTGVTSITLPRATSGGPQLLYSFGYAKCQGCSTMWGEVHQITTPTGATISYSFARDLQISDMRPPGYPFNPIRQKTVSYAPQSGDLSASSHTKVYSFTPGFTTITHQDGSTISYVYAIAASSPATLGLVTQIGYQDSSSTSYTWCQNTPALINAGTSNGQYSGPANPYICGEVLTLADQSSTPKTYVIDKNGNSLGGSEYGWTSGGPLPAPIRKTVNTYWVSTYDAATTPVTDNTNAYWNTSAPANLRAIQSSSIAGADGVTVAASQFDYDNPLTTANLFHQWQWDDSKPNAKPYPGNPSGSTLTLSSTKAIGTIRTYGAHGNLSTMIDSNSKVTTLGYGADNLYPTTVQMPQAATVGPAFDGESGVLKNVTNVDGSVTTYGYDLIGRQIRAEQTASGIDRKVTTNYDDVGLVVTTRQDRDSASLQSLTTTIYYDALGRVKSVVDAAGNTVRKAYSFDGSGATYELSSNPYSTTADATMGWTLTSRQYAANCSGSVGNVNGYSERIQRFDGSTVPSFSTTGGSSSSCFYHNGATVSGSDEAKIAHTYGFDSLQRMTSADGVTYGYDPLDNLHTFSARTFNFGSLSRLQSATNPEGGVVTYTYDNNGNLTLRRDARGVSTCFGLWTSSTCDGSQGYDGLNRLLLKTYSDGTPAAHFTYDGDTKGTLYSVGNSASTTVYTHDAVGRATGSTQTTTGAGSLVFSYAYNLADLLTRVTYPSGRIVAYTPDSANRVSAVADTTNGKSYASSIRYTAPGPVDQMTLGNSLAPTVDLNARLLPTAIALCPGGPCARPIQPSTQNPLTLGYTYEPNNNYWNIKSTTITTPALSATQNFTYDSVNRLTTASEGTAWSRAFNYTNGNMYVTPTANLSNFTPQSSAWFDANNRLTNSGLPIGYEPGGSGNLTTLGGYTFTYDAEGRQLSSTLNGVTTSYVYDGLGQRVTKQTGVNTTIYAYDVSGNLAAEDDSASAASPCGTPTCYLTADHLGSTRLLTDSSGNVKARYDYLPFGEELQAGVGGRTAAMGYSSTPDAFNLKFTGQVRDPETLSDYFNARYYRPDQGRFNSPDPDSAGVDPTNTQTWNGYAYVASNPMMFVDPSGLGSFSLSDLAGSDGSSGGINWQVGTGGMPAGFALGYLGLGGWGTQPPAQQRLAWINASRQLGGFAQANAQVPLFKTTATAKTQRRPEWVNGITSVFGYDQNDPRPSCFAGFVSDTLSNLNPVSPSLSILGEAVGRYYADAKLSQALVYAASRSSTRLGTRALAYPYKSSVFRGLLRQAGKVGNVTAASSVVFAEGQAFWDEIQSIQEGRCQ